MKFARVRRRRVLGVDLTPMIDVTLQLIIFFMLTNQFGELARTEIELPREPGDPNAEPGAADLTVDIAPAAGGGAVYLVDAAPVSLDDVSAFIAREAQLRGGDPSGIVVLVRPERTLPAAHLNRLVERLVALGVRQWRIGTVDPNDIAQPPPAGGGAG